MRNRLTGLYSGECVTCNGKLGHSDQSPSITDKEFKAAAKAIFNGSGYRPGDLGSVQEYINLSSSIYKSLGPKSIGLKSVQIPSRMLEALERDIFHFSGLKTHAMLFNASRMLLDDKGDIKPFNRFLKDIEAIKKDYLERYLEAEYEFAIGSAQMAANWAATSESGEFHLQYRTAADDKVRASHQKLHNVTLPKEDDFWNEYYPPNGWRCRCTTVEVIKENEPATNSAEAAELGREATTYYSKSGSNKLEIFRFNPGKQEVIFPPGHPYRKLLGAAEALESISSSIQASSRLVYRTGEGRLYIHRLVGENDPDYQRLLAVGREIAKGGRKVHILPGISVSKNHDEYNKIYGRLNGTKFDGKCPDFLIDGEFFEEKGFQSNDPKKALSNMLSRAVRQSDRIIIQDPGLTDYQINKVIKRRIMAGQSIKSLWIIRDGKLIEFL